MEAGKLVPDELILNLLKEETKGAENGWLIDGMPRTKVQAEAMDKMGLKPQVFVSLEVRRGAGPLALGMNFRFAGLVPTAHIRFYPVRLFPH